MRILKFIVDKQIIRRDPNCDFSNLVSGTKGYLKADKGLSNWKAHLAEHPLKVMTYLDTPIEIDLSESQLQAYRSIHTNKPTTIVSNDADTYMSLDYTADTKLYIDNKIKEVLQNG